MLSDLWTYSANRVPEIADSIVEIDRAMKTGFNWEMGPFELWDAAGVAPDRRAHEEGRPSGRGQRREVAGLAARTTWYADDPKTASGRKYFDLATRELQS